MTTAPRSLRILKTCANRGDAGTMIRCLRYGQALVERGHQVTIIRSSNRRWVPTKQQRDGVEIIEMPRFVGDRFLPKTLRPNDLLLRIIHVLTHHYDVHHAYQEFENTAWPWFLSRRLKRARIHVYDSDDLWTDGGYLGDPNTKKGLGGWHYSNVRRLESSTRTLADGMTVVSQALWDRAVAHGADPRRLLLLRPAIACDTGPTSQNKGRQSLGIDPEAPLLVFPGFGQQDLLDCIDVLATVRKNHPSAHLLIIGPRNPHALQGRTTSEQQDAMTFTGRVAPEEVSNFLAMADFAILPYPDTPINRYRWPTKLSDYCAAGLPVLCGPAGEVGAFLESEQCGAVFRTPDEAAQTVDRWLNDPAQRRKMAQAALQLAENSLNLALQADALETFYLALLAREECGLRDVP